MKLYSEFEIMMANNKRQLADKTSKFSAAVLGDSPSYVAYLFGDLMTLKFKVQIYRNFEPIAQSIYSDWFDGCESEQLLDNHFCQAVADHGVNSLQMADQCDDTTMAMCDAAMDQWRREMDEMIDQCGIQREI